MDKPMVIQVHETEAGRSATARTDRTEHPTPTVADIILQLMALRGIKHIYGVAGDAILPFLDAVGRQKEIAYFAVRHEAAAAFMASAEGKCAGRLAACLGTSGPGLVNMLNGIADAAVDRVPLLVLTGQVETKKMGTEAKQYLEQQQMIAPLAVFSETLLHPEATVDILQRAIIAALTRRGVAHVSVPKDLFAAACSQEVRPPARILRDGENVQQLAAAITPMETARQPMILIGEGARTAADHVMQLAEKWQAGIIETLAAKGTVPYAHPLHVGGIGEGGTLESAKLLQKADCVLVIGANWWPEGYVPRRAQVIQIDRSPANIETHPLVTCGIVGDAAEIIPALLFRLPKGRRGQWETAVRTAKEAAARQLDKERNQPGPKIAPQRLIAALDETVAEDAIIAVDTGDHTVWFNRIFRGKRQKVLFSGKWRTMGFALPAALAAQLLAPTKQVIALAGDGGFAMTMMELSTVVKYRLPVKIVIVNNGALAMEKNGMIAQGFAPFGVDLTNPDFARLAFAFGIKGVRVERVQELVPALREALAGDEAVLIDVLTSAAMPPFTS